MPASLIRLPSRTPAGMLTRIRRTEGSRPPSDPARRREHFDELVATRYESARAINQSTTFHIDDVIDPADSRRWVVLAMDVAHGQEQHPAKRRPNIDAW